MRKRKDAQTNSQSPTTADKGNDQISIQLGGGETPTDTSKIEAPALVPSERANGDAETQGDAAKLAFEEESRGVQPAGAAPVIGSIADDRPGAGAAAAGMVARAISAARSMPLAASITLAVILGATAGSLATAGLSALTGGETSPGVASIQDMRALKESIVRMNTEIGSLKAAIDTSGRSATGQLAKFGDRIDRFERAQAEPAAKLAKITEAVERIERRAATSTATSDTTASLAVLTPPEPVRPAGPPIVDGWVLRGVANGAALIQGRLGVIAVEPGDHLPGLGRIENIRRQDGRWVVVTSKGLIVTR